VALGAPLRAMNGRYPVRADRARRNAVARHQRAAGRRRAL